MIRTPSSAMWRRSRSATSPMSPTPSPSTNVTPTSTLVDEPHALGAQLDDRAVLGQHDRGRPARPTPGPSARSRPASGTRRGSASPPSAVRGRTACGSPPASRARRRAPRAFSSCSTSAPALRELVDRVVHAQLVPRHRACGEDHRVAALDGDGLMVVVGDPRQRRHAARPGCRYRGSPPPRRGTRRARSAGSACPQEPPGSRGSRRCSGSCASSGRRRRPSGRLETATSIACCIR